ncbi:alanine/glycine:cation symporter family protein [Parasphingorhabdus cellanae]|uniref:Alanine:cation symporter family protein n=1 Tax=Parasphingorhabdus cellanae TaxID=2806553 RepID=A0ABX7T851_9SPHN|nr:alanine/glycine:cation symporter family protein [Parasphingorhabdus cellanae]QTD56624.1 alanine:cation symporter family protein [Parasphingorhabdus cellanae]
MIDFLSDIIGKVATLVFSKIPFFGAEIPWIVLWLAIPMLLFTLWMGFLNIRALPLSIRILRGKYDEPDAPGTISQFSALTTALSGTVGLGNIAGVAIAIATGGPGAAFWMFIIGFFAMTLKCVEVTLSLMFREVDPSGAVRGGPMYNLKNGFKQKGWPKLGLVLGGIYAVLVMFIAIPMVQVNQSLATVSEVSGFRSNFDNNLTFGVIMAFFVGLVVIGGVKWLGRVTSIMVPLMALVYLSGVLTIIAFNFAQIPDAIALIIRDAFSGQAAGGGLIGAFIIGMQRAVYSSEAGVGSAAIAHSQARTKEPASEGLVALLEPMLDTVIICSLGAIAIVLAGTWQGADQDIRITAAAFAQISDWFPWMLTIAVLLFAHSTLCSVGFYGLKAYEYLFGEGPIRAMIYKIVYIGILPVGALLEIATVIDLVDSAFFLASIPNVIALYLFAPQIKRELYGYLKRQAESQESESHNEVSQTR